MLCLLRRKAQMRQSKREKFQRSFDLIKSPEPIKTYQNKLWLPTKRQDLSTFEQPGTEALDSRFQRLTNVVKCEKKIRRRRGT